MSKTPLTGLRLLRENDVNNASSINYNLSRLDALSTLVVESLTVTTEPENPLLGQVWYVDTQQPIFGDFWGAVTERSLLIWAPDGEGIPAWQVAPVWEGAYAYDKDSEAFVTFTGTEWAVPSKNKILSVTLPQDSIFDYDGVSTDASNWYPLLRVETDHRLVQIHCSARLRASAMQSIGEDLTVNSPAAMPDLPYVLPKLAISQDRTTAPDPLEDILVDGYSEFGGNALWVPPRDVLPSTGNPGVFAREDYVQYTTGIAANFDVAKATEFEDGATGDLAFAPQSGYPGYSPTGPGALLEIQKLTGFAWIYYDAAGPREILNQLSPTGATGEGWSLSIVESPGAGQTQKVLQLQTGRDGRVMYAWPSDTNYSNQTSNSLTDPLNYVAPTSLANGLLDTNAEGQWIHVGFSHQRDTNPIFFINGERTQGTKPYYGSNETENDNSAIRSRPFPLKIGEGLSGGMLVDEVKLYTTAYRQQTDIGQVDYNNGSGTTRPQGGLEDEMVFRCSMDAGLVNKNTSAARWYDDGEVSQGASGINPGGVAGPEGASFSFDELPVISASPAAPGYLLVNFEDSFGGDGSTTVADIADITIQVTYSG